MREMHSEAYRRAYWLAWRERYLAWRRESRCTYCRLDFEAFRTAGGLLYHVVGGNRHAGCAQ